MNFANEEIYPECFFISRKVEIGGHTKGELIQKLQQSSILINEYGERLLADDMLTISETKYCLQTVELTVRNLGFPEGATTAQIFKRANELGLELCPMELGPYLRLQYLDQPEGFSGNSLQKHQAPSGSVTIASEKLTEDDDFPKGFYLRRINGVLWLRDTWQTICMFGIQRTILSLEEVRNHQGGVNELRKILKLCFLLLLVSCETVSDSSHIKEEDVVKVLQECGIEIIKADFPQGNVFGSDLRNVTPGTYLLNEKPLFIYEFENENDLEKGIREFDKKTATAELVSYSILEKRNILIFYVHEQDFDSGEIPFEKEIQESLDRISEG